MKGKHRFATPLRAFLALLLVCATFPAFALVKDLAVAQAELTPPGGGAPIPMWAFLEDTGTCPGSPVAWSVGPKIVVPPGDNLTINLRNCLPSGGEPVSVVIAGQAMPDGFSPVLVGGRVRSFVAEAAAGGGTQSYSWSTLQPGTYLYQSGTHPQVQVQMGLYGALTKDSAAGMAYPGVSYTEEQDLFFSEVDPTLHAQVDAGTFSGSTLDYHPEYFLLHGHDGAAWADVSINAGSVPPACIDSGVGPSDSLLLRLYNAGLRELAPMLLGGHFDLVAEGGSKYPFARTQYQTLLMPGSTKDALFSPGYPGDFEIIERRLNLTDGTDGGGGMQTCIRIADPSNDAPQVAIDAPADGSSFNQGDSITFSGTANDTEDGDLSADLSWSSDLDGNIGSGASFATTSLSAGTHNITAAVTDSGGISGVDSISVTVAGAPNTAPVVTITAPTDGSSFNQGDSITFSGTANDAEDGDLSANLSWSSNLDGNIGSGASFATTGLSAGTHTITASVTDSGGLPGSDTISLTVSVANTAPVVTISAPADGSTFETGDLIGFAGTAIDNEDGDLSANLSWSSNLDGTIGSGPSFSTTLSLGSHTIEATVTDSGGLPGTDAITVDVQVPADTLNFRRLVYRAQRDRLTMTVQTTDTSGGLTMTAVMDGDGDGAFETPLGTLPAAGTSVYRANVSRFSVNFGFVPTSASVVRVTSSLGGSVEANVTIN